MQDNFERATTAVSTGGLVVYPTETVYGLGADALDTEAIDRVYRAKQRPPSKPLSLGVSSVEDIQTYATLSKTEAAFCDRFLPGPVTVLLERRPIVPDVLVGGRSRVGIRIPAHDIALQLLRRCGPLTATSANLSGQPSATRIQDIDQSILSQSVVLDDGETQGTESTVVNVSTGEISRRGALANEIEEWVQTR